MRLFNTQKFFTKNTFAAISGSIFTLIHTIAFALIAAIRPILGNLGVCIYRDEPCQAYVANLFATQPFFYALAKTPIRLVSCNPINGLVRAITIKK